MKYSVISRIVFSIAVIFIFLTNAYAQEDTVISDSKSWSFNVGLNGRTGLYQVYKKKNLYPYLDFNYLATNYGGYGLKFQFRKDLLKTTIVFEPIFRYDDIFYDSKNAEFVRGFIIDSSLYLLWRKKKFNIGFGGLIVNSNVVITYQPIGYNYTKKKYLAFYGMAIRLEKSVKKYFLSTDLIYVGYKMTPIYNDNSSSISLQGSITRRIDFKQEVPAY